MRSAAKRVLSSLWPAVATNNVILAYHSIGAKSPWSVSTYTFEHQLALLAQHYSVVSLSDLLANTLTSKRQLAAITIDDGYEDNYVSAFPILLKHSMPFTIFVTVGFISRHISLNWSPHYGDLQPLSWDQIRTMHAAGVDIQSHGYSHSRLATCSEQELDTELRVSREVIQQALDKRIEILAYPFGQRHDYSSAVVRHTSQVGYTHGLTTEERTISDLPDAFAIPRILIQASDTHLDLIQKLTGRRNYMAPFGRFRSSLITRGLLNPSVPDRTAGRKNS